MKTKITWHVYEHEYQVGLRENLGEKRDKVEWQEEFKIMRKIKQ